MNTWAFTGVLHWNGAEIYRWYNAIAKVHDELEHTLVIAGEFGHSGRTLVIVAVYDEMSVL